MEHLPLLIPVIFVIITLITLLLLCWAAKDHHLLFPVILGWLFLQGALTFAGFYLQTSGTPPRFALLLFTPVILILILLITQGGRQFLNNFDIGRLIWLHTIRVPVELVLFALYIHHLIPRLMTFEGGNFDILSGLSAPLIWYFGFKHKLIGRNGMIAWNICCLLLLLNIVIRAVLSAPFRFQRFGFEQPDIALLYFPYSWLPAFIVPAVLFAHLTALRNLLRTQKL